MKNPKTPVRKTITSSRGNPQPQLAQQQQQQQHHQQQSPTTSTAADKQTKTNNNIDRKNIEPICDICAQNVPGPEREKIFASGKCDHPVCYVCSARLRAICDQYECPICREKLDNVTFSSTNKSKPFAKLDLKECLFNEKYNIYFENEIVRDVFEKLLKLECLECAKTNNGDSGNGCNNGANSGKPSNNDKQQSTSNKLNKRSSPIHDGSAREFPDVLSLRNHLFIVHKLKLCDLCLTHNKLFPFEFSYYNVDSLRRHIKQGEPKTSHRGHPNCDLCHRTFFNADEMLQHMSREHYHCHLCGRSDSAFSMYFLEYDDLRLHFKSNHFLCERGNCRHEQFTSAFENRIDYQMHIVQVHGNPSGNMSRGEARQQRTITLDSAPHRAPTTRSTTLPPNSAIVSVGTVATANNNSNRQQIPESLQSQLRQQRLPSGADFPALGYTSTSPRFTITQQHITSANHYPSLAQTTPRQEASSLNAPSHSVVAGPSSSRDSFVRSAGGGFKRPEQLSKMDFPPLPEQPKPQTNKNSKTQAKSRKDRDTGILTLDQLISTSLSISARSNNSKTQNKTNKSAKSKSSKPKPLKIQLSG